MAQFSIPSWALVPGDCGPRGAGAQSRVGVEGHVVGRRMVEHQGPGVKQFVWGRALRQDFSGFREVELGEPFKGGCPDPTRPRVASPGAVNSGWARFGAPVAAARWESH